MRVGEPEPNADGPAGVIDPHHTDSDKGRRKLLVEWLKRRRPRGVGRDCRMNPSAHEAWAELRRLRGFGRMSFLSAIHSDAVAQGIA